MRNGLRSKMPRFCTPGRVEVLSHGYLHAAAKAEQGLLIMNLWPSHEGSQAASRDERRLGVIAAQGLEPGQIRPRHYEVANYVLFEGRDGGPPAIADLT